MHRRITVTITDYNRLAGLVELASLKLQMPKSIQQFCDRLQAAQMVPQESVGEQIVTMNSRVLVKELNSGRESEITLSYPRESRPQEKRISVFSEIGIALLGRQAKDVVSWNTPNGPGIFEITKVTYQPEAAGDFSL